MICPLVVIKVLFVLISSPTSGAMVVPDPIQTQDQVDPAAPSDFGDNIIKMIFQSSALLCPGK